MKILVYGYGNPGRKDDGLGPAFAELVEKWIVSERITNVFTDSNYQLNIEDAYEIRDYDTVLFVDATVEEDVKDFKLTTVQPANNTSFFMHSVHPSYILEICQQINHRSPDVYLLHIKGYEFDMEESMSENAGKNLQKSFKYVRNWLTEIGIHVAEST